MGDSPPLLYQNESIHTHSFSVAYNRMEPITREQLQNMKAEADRINRRNNVRNYVCQYYQQIKQFATSSIEMRRVIDTRGHINDMCNDIVIELRTLFPGCLVEYRETRNMNNKVIESGIIVDWS
jgi:hypothetical protein